MTAGKARSSLLLRNEIHPHLPLSKTELLSHQEWLRGTVHVMAHPAVSAFVPIHMKPVQVSCSVPESGTPFGFFSLHEICIMAEET